MAGQDIRDRGRKAITEMFSMLDNISVDNLKTDGITLRSGNKILKFEVVSETELDFEAEIREEVRIKLAEKMAELKENLNRRINDMMNLTRQVKDEAERKVREYKMKLQDLEAMPNITYDLAKKGLSVAKGNEGELIWLVRGVYWPKYVVDHGDRYRQIEPRYGKKMMSEIVFLIRTKKQIVLEVSTRQPIGLQKFQHYHQRTSIGSTDCWGKWQHASKWDTPNDILKIAKEAEAVLETINFGSIATSNPRGLPQKESLAEHLLDRAVDVGRVDTKASRLGINTTNIGNLNNDVWTA